MKKLIIISFIMAISSVVYAQEPVDEFFGLKFGEVYTLEQITEHVGDNGTFTDDLGDVDWGTVYRAYLFNNVTFNDRVASSFIFLTLPHGTFAGVYIHYTADNIPEGKSLDDVYEELKTELTDRYGTLGDFPVEGHPEVKRLLKMQDEVVIILDKYISEDAIPEVDVSYISLVANVNEALLELNRPTIQDTFFGMKMGSIQSVSTLISALKYKGEYLNEQYDSYGKNVSFTKLIFAGRTWDYGEFQLSDKGELYGISVYDSLDDGYIYDDEKKEAERIYETYKEKLNVKYGQHEEMETETDDSKTIVYLGENDMVIILTNERSKSQGGTYRRYVKLAYIQTAINGRISKSSNDEL